MVVRKKEKKLCQGNSISIRRPYTFMNAYTAQSAAGYWAVGCSLARVSARCLCLKCVSWCFLAKCRLVLVRTHRDTVNILTGHLYMFGIEILMKPPSNIPTNKRLSLHYKSLFGGNHVFNTFVHLSVSSKNRFQLHFSNTLHTLIKHHLWYEIKF